MTWEIVIILIILAAALTSFIAEKISSDLTAICVFAVLLVFAVLPWDSAFPEMEELFGVFANHAPLTVAAMFILSAALDKTGVIDGIAYKLTGLARLGFYPFLIVMILCVAVVSAFVNNTPVVVVFLPVVLSLARSLDVPASKLLIPLSYASIFGGVCTLVGTSTNLLGSGIMVQYGQEPLGMFEIAWVGVPLLFAAAVYLLIFGNRLLPSREPLSAILSEEERKEFLTEAIIPRRSPFIGKTFGETGLHRKSGIHLLEITRDDQQVPTAETTTTPLREGDILVLSCRPSGFAHTRSVEGMDLLIEQEMGIETIAAHEGSMVEGVIGPRSTLIGRTLREVNFRQRYRMVPLAIHRRGVNIRQRIRRTPLEFGDTLLMMGTERAREELRKSDDILLLDLPSTPSQSRHGRAPIVIGTIAVIVGLVSLGIVPIAAATLIGVTVLFLTRCLTPREGYDSIEWSILFLIYGMLGLGVAMQTTGASGLIAGAFVSLVDATVADAWKPLVLLAGVYLITTVFTEMLSNNAGVVLMTPIAIGLAVTLGVDPRPFVIATCVAASASFATPIGYQTNTYVYGVGGYRFTDFAKVGLPLNLLYFSVSMVIIPRVWEF